MFTGPLCPSRLVSLISCCESTDRILFRILNPKDQKYLRIAGAALMFLRAAWEVLTADL